MCYSIDVLGERKKLRKQISALEKQVVAHQEKIDAEMERRNPDYGKMHHWEAEIFTWVKQIQAKRERLGFK